MYYALVLFFFLEYVRPASLFPPLGALRLNLIVLLLIAAGGFFGRRRVTNGDVLSELNTKLLLSLLGLITISIVLADSSLLAFNVLNAVAGYVIVYWAIVRYVTDLDHLKGVFKVLVFVHVIVALLTPSLFTSSERHYIANSSFLGDPNDFALSVDMSIPLCLFLLVDARKTLLKLVFVGTLMFLVMSVAATQSRGGTLALVAVGLYYWWNSDRKVLTGVLACGAIAIVMTLAPSHYFERLQSISTYEEDTSAMGRVNAWKAGTQMMLANPILGVGAGHFGRNFTKYVPGGEDFRWKTAHSVYFLAMGELGVPGIALLLTFLGTNLVVTMKRGREVRKRGDPEAVTDARLLACVCVSLVAFAIAGAFLSALYYPHMAVLSALFVVSRRIVKERKTVPQVALAAPSKPEMTYHWALRPLMELHTASLRVGNKGSST